MYDNCRFSDNGAAGNAVNIRRWYANPRGASGLVGRASHLDTSKAPSNVPISSVDNLKHPANNIIGTNNYTRTADASSGTTVRIILRLQSQGKTHRFQPEQFAVAQVAQDVYNNASYTSVTHGRA